MSYLWAWS